MIRRIDPLSFGLPLTPDGHPDFNNAYYDVFNPDRTVGVRTDISGRAVAVHLGDAVATMEEQAVRAQILAVASVAAVRASYAGRQRSEYWASVRGEVLEPHAVELYATAIDVVAAREAAFGPDRATPG